MEYKIIKQRHRNKRNLDFSNQLRKQFGLSLLCADYLISKGIADIDSAERFLRPKLNHLFSPNCFNDMDIAVDRINEAISAQEQIFIYGDYDCDGICASVILYKALVHLGALVDVYLPDRFSDGYGMNINAVDKLKKQNVSLIITVDNGITAVKEIEYANSIGIDVILTDHHQPPSVIPDAIAVIDPKNSEDLYPFSEICGSVVALKLVEALGVEDKKLVCELITFAAIATVADLVPLIEENRTITSIGLKYLKYNLNYGLTELIKICGISDMSNISSSDVAFKIAPRINACGRLANARMAFELFTTADLSRIKQLSDEVNALNEERKSIEDDIISRAENYLIENDLLNKERVLFIFLDDAHEGVVGIAAGEICEKYNRPTIVGSIKDGKATASCRSIPGFNIYDALSSADYLFVKFGGHSQAAGFTVKEENIDELVAIVNQQAVEMNVDNLLIKHLYYDIETVPAYVTKAAVEQMDAFAPYGLKNPRPVFKFEGVVIRSISYIGTSGKHVRCEIMTPSAIFRGIGFSMADQFSQVDISCKYDILFTPSINEFRGVSELQLEIKDLQPHIELPKQYCLSLYNHFYVNSNVAVDFIPKSEQILSLNVEGCINEYPNAFFIAYGKDALLRVMRYCEYKNIKLNLSYGTQNALESNAVNLLVNPTEDMLSAVCDMFIVLDPPCFCGYESRLYENNEKAFFLRSEAYVPSVYIDREYIAFIYKKLPALRNLENSLDLFIEFLNSQSILQVNYFLLRICLDILSELSIIDYEIRTDKLYIEFTPISGVKDINTSSVMQKLAKAYA